MDDPSANKIKRVELLGYKGTLKFTQSTAGLTVELPGRKISDVTCTLKIAGSHLHPAPIALVAAVVTPDAKGQLNFLADDATLHGEQLKLEEQGGKSCIGYWNNASESISWNAAVAKSGAYRVRATVATVFNNAAFVVAAGGETVDAKIEATGAWDKFRTIELGLIRVKQPGSVVVQVRPKDADSWRAINLNSVQFMPAD